MFSQDFQKSYVMTSPNVRSEIIQKCKNKEIVSETRTGQIQDWWLKKHNPENEIPKNIYSLGSGTIRELFDRYNNKFKYGQVEWEEFIDYTRELIKQNIML